MWDSCRRLAVYALKPHGVHFHRLCRGRRDPDSSANPGGVPHQALARLFLPWVARGGHRTRLPGQLRWTADFPKSTALCQALRGKATIVRQPPTPSPFAAEGEVGGILPHPLGRLLLRHHSLTESEDGVPAPFAAGHGGNHSRQRKVCPHNKSQRLALLVPSRTHLQRVLCRLVGTVPAVVATRRGLPPSDPTQVPPEATVPREDLRGAEG
ncbi:unnamed protein product [Euphydryas editha]|uniref:Uncharacterized protein n=1 Tax=Euphydryas editha TaxID=104508 RepID=A0AAU9UQA6_EUPED|nr:unnamed protein product [Euphydryas editha]